VINFADRVLAATREKQSCVVVGLDPRPDWLPAEFGLSAGKQTADEQVADAIVEFNRRLIRAVAPAAAAVKPQVAFYEQFGWQGVRAYAETIALAHKAGLIVIGDVKRSDIGTTAEAYASAHLGKLDADAITVNPYLGSDGIKPFTDFCKLGKGLFVLVKTSNPSSAELQDWPRPPEAGFGGQAGHTEGGQAGEGQTLYRRVAELVETWGEAHRGECGYSAVGAVVGATFPKVATELRQAMPHTIFLLPGYGAQGADAEACRACFDKDGFGALVSSSRGVNFAYRSEPYKSRFGEAKWEAAVQAAAIDMREALEKVRAGSSS